MMSVRRQIVDITLMSDTAFTLRSATAGGHETLLHVPGAALLGLAASRLPTGLDRWTVLHSGKVRFGDSLPLTADGNVARPFPSCLVAAKGARPAEDGSLVTTNTAVAAPPSNVQVKAVKRDYITDNLIVYRPDVSDRLKTAVDPERGSAAEAMLFEVQTLKAGQRFRGCIEADHGAFSNNPSDDEASFKKLIDAMASRAGKHARLGRSRSTEFGEVRIATVDIEASTATGAVSGRVAVLLLSNLSIVDENGNASGTITPTLFGLQGGRFSAGESSIAARRYTPFNGHHGIPDMERQVLRAGSVLVFTGVTGGHSGELRVGMHRAAGLGHALVAPAMLARESVTIRPAKLEPPGANIEVVRPDDRMLEWMESKVGLSSASAKARREAAKYIVIMKRAYEEAEAYNGRLSDGLSGPSRKQWNDVASAAKSANGIDDLFSRLFNDETGIARAKDPVWRTQIAPKMSYGERLRSDVFRAVSRDDQLSPLTLEIVAIVAQEMATYVSSGRLERTRGIAR